MRSKYETKIQAQNMSTTKCGNHMMDSSVGDGEKIYDF